MNNTTSLSEICSRAWTKTTGNLTILVGLQLVFYAVFFLLSLVITALKAGMPIAAMFAQLINLIVNVIFSAGMIKICLMLIDNKEVGTKDIFPTTSQGIRYMISNLIVAFVAVMIFLILYFCFEAVNPSFFVQNDFNKYLLAFFVAIPLLIIYMRFLFASYFIVDADTTAIGGLTASFIITKGNIGKLLLMILIIIGINILGLLCLVVGLLLTIPMSMLILGYMYRGLKEELESNFTERIL